MKMLKEAFPEFEPREGQLKMMNVIYDSFEKEKTRSLKREQELENHARAGR